MPLTVVPVDSANEKQHRTIIATVLNELVKQFPQHGDWTAVIRGSGTAGTYEIASQNCRYTRIGRRVWLDVFIQMAAVVTGGGTGFIQITGVPFVKIANSIPIGGVRVDGVDWTAGANVVLSWNDSGVSSTLVIDEVIDNASAGNVAISGLGANDAIYGSICYETDDP